MRSPQPIIAIDARLVGGTHTGDSTYWAGLLSGLSRVQHGFHIVLFGNSQRPEDVSKQFRWIEVPAKNNRYWSMVAFPLAARKAGASVIHTQYSLSPFVGQRGITTIHDVSFLIGPEWFKPRDRFLLSRSIPLAVRRAARVITVSESSKNEIERFIPSANGKVAVTYNACPDWIQSVDRGKAVAAARTLGIDGPFLLTVGTRWPRKNMDLALQAAALLPKNLPHKLVVTGKQGWGATELGSRGVATGYVSNEMLSNLYSAADLYLAPSRHEGFGIPLLEAFRCGCPVLASTGGALPEVAGDAAIIEPDWQPEQWANTIERLLRDTSTLRELRQRGFEREKQFTWQECARRTLEVYREVAT
ncbi:MAG: glycosyltransferase family 4 protein [Fimbriimonas sp.]